MAIRVALNHRTTYHYDRLVSLSPQTVRLRPAPHCRTPVTAYSMRVTPTDHFINWQQDPQGNFLARLVFPRQTRRFEVEVDLVAELAVVNPFDFFLEPEAECFPFRYGVALARELRPFCETEPAGPLLLDLLERIDRRPRRTVSFLVELNQQLQAQIAYVIRMEPGIQACEETLAKRSGSCRDSAWLLVQILRQLGLAARFVSGYLIQLKADVPALDGPSGPGADFTDLHAWAEVYLPGAGWVGLDPTSGLFAGEGHIPLACSPEPGSAAPISGAVDECEATFDFAMSVVRVEESPRVTAPYGDETWRAIEAVGRDVDAQLERDDVRLTMGGEPTFVAIDAMDEPEWNTEALGPTKRQRAAELLKRLAGQFSRGGLLHFGQGKWYPGEPLPRWAFGCYWRADGQPIWLDPGLVAEECRDYGFDAETARRFATLLARRLDLPGEAVLPAYEDPYYYAVQERRLPVNLDPLALDLDQPAERRRLARVLAHGLGRPSGMVLPLERQWWQGRARWTSGPWLVGEERLFLVPGDSPIGLRLPLDSLPYVPGGGPTLREGPARPAARAAAAHRATERLSAAGSAPPSVIRRRDGAGRPHGPVRGASRRSPLRVHAASRGARRLPRARGRGGGHRARARGARSARRLYAAFRSAAEGDQGDARSGRDRGQRSSFAWLERARPNHDRPLRARAPISPRRGEVRPGWPTHGDRRRQPRGARWRHAGR